MKGPRFLISQGWLNLKEIDAEIEIWRTNDFDVSFGCVKWCDLGFSWTGRCPYDLPLSMSLSVFRPCVCCESAAKAMVAFITDLPSVIVSNSSVHIETLVPYH